MFSDHDTWKLFQLTVYEDWNISQELSCTLSLIAFITQQETYTGIIEMNMYWSNKWFWYTFF